MAKKKSPPADALQPVGDYCGLLVDVVSLREIGSPHISPYRKRCHDSNVSGDWESDCRDRTAWRSTGGLLRRVVEAPGERFDDSIWTGLLGIECLSE